MGEMSKKRKILITVQVILALIYGIAYLLTASFDYSLRGVVPEPFIFFYSYLLIVLGITGIIGIKWNDWEKIRLLLLFAVMFLIILIIFDFINYPNYIQEIASPYLLFITKFYILLLHALNTTIMSALIVFDAIAYMTK